jgi:hypothetical protein
MGNTENGQSGRDAAFAGARAIAAGKPAADRVAFDVN